jgi:hypothetical protein
MPENEDRQDEGLDPAVDSATGQVIDSDYEDDAPAGHDVAGAEGSGAPSLEEIGAVDSENTSVSDPVPEES